MTLKLQLLHLSSHFLFAPILVRVELLGVIVKHLGGEEGLEGGTVHGGMSM